MKIKGSLAKTVVTTKKKKISANASTRELSAIKLIDPQRFHREVNSVLRISKTVLEAAETLRVSHATLKRWILEDPGLVEGCILRGPGNPALMSAHTKPQKKR